MIKISRNIESYCKLFTIHGFIKHLMGLVGISSRDVLHYYCILLISTLEQREMKELEALDPCDLPHHLLKKIPHTIQSNSNHKGTNKKETINKESEHEIIQNTIAQNTTNKYSKVQKKHLSKILVMM